MNYYMTVNGSEDSHSNITLENVKYKNVDDNLEKTGSVTAQIGYKNEEIKETNLKTTTVTTNVTDNMVGTVEVTKECLNYGCILCPAKLFKQELLAQEHFKKIHKNIVSKNLLLTTNNKPLQKERRNDKLTKNTNTFIRVKDILEGIQINETVTETKILNQKPFYLYGCCLCPHFMFFLMKDIVAHNTTYHGGSRGLIAEMPLIPITKLIQNDSKQSELILGCLCDHIIINESLAATEIVNKTYREILMQRSETYLDCDLENKLKVIYKYSVGNGYHMTFKVIIDPTADTGKKRRKDGYKKKRAKKAKVEARNNS